MVKYVLIGILHSLLDFDSQLQEDEQLARALQESLNAESPPRYGNGNTHPPQYGNGNTYPPQYGNGTTHPPRYGNGNGNAYPPPYENGNAYPPRYGNGQTYQPVPMYYPIGSRYQFLLT